MAKNNSLPDFLTDLANTIREVEGTSEPINPQDFSDRVRAIGAGGGGDSQAVVDALFDGSITEVSSNVALIRQYMFSGCKLLTAASLPNIKDIPYQAFSDCYALSNVDLPNVASIGKYAFSDCKALPVLILPNLQKSNDYAFEYCEALTSVVLPKLKAVEGGYLFSSNYMLTKLVIGTEISSVSTMYSTTPFVSCYHILGTVNSTYNPDGLKDGYIYVPLSLVSNYRSATNWSKYATQIMPYVATVEELASVDGTTYDKACVGADYVEYTYNGTSWEVYR